MTPENLQVTRRGLMMSAAAGIAFGAAHQLIGGSDARASDDLKKAARPIDEWTAVSPREEIRPVFAMEGKGADGQPTLLIKADSRAGLDGCWKRTFAVSGGQHYRFSALFKAQHVAVPRRSVIVKLNWRDAAGKAVPLDTPAVRDVLPGMTAMAETEFPVASATRADGWTEMAGTYRAPGKATQLIVQLHLQWAPSSEVRWSNVSLVECDAPAARKVRLATIHLYPRGGKTPMDNCRMYEPLIAQAAEQKADLVVLGETLTYVGLGKKFPEVAEPIPGGPSTQYFGELAKKHNMYIVPGLVEREGHLIYNAAVLMGPDGQIVGKYRKVCLPRSEIEGGICPGSEYPVFDTRIGKVAMMVCYDGFFPEVARELSNRGAEIIAWPVWGCNPLLGRARANENHTYVVSSTYEDVKRNWMISAVFDHRGEPIAHAKDWGTVAVAEVDLSAHTKWPGLGDFRAQIARHRPVAVGEPVAM